MSALPKAFLAAGSQQILASIWQRNLPIVRERLDTLKGIARQAETGALPDDLRREGADIAHKLAGSLGMFGYLQGTEVARALEIVLDADGPMLDGSLRELTAELLRAVPL